jgi:phosphate transport system substrate-binding protein
MRQSIIYGVVSSVLALCAAAQAATDPVKSANPNTITWAGCGISKHAFMDELSKAFEKKSGIKILLQGGGATAGIQKVSSGEVNVGASCRANIESMAQERDAYQVPVAWDAIAMITHPTNPVDSITTQQARDIYTGKITNWKELGGNDQPIELYVRRGKISGVGRTVRELLFSNYDQEFTGAKHVVPNTAPLEEGIEKNLNGLGATGVASAHRRKVKILKLNGKEPSFDNIRNGQYLMYRPLYLVSKGSASDPRVKEFISFAVSREGQTIIRKTGTVPYSDAMGLVMKQLEQYDKATSRGLYTTKAN